jgi:hypothetical protein
VEKKVAQSHLARPAAAVSLDIKLRLNFMIIPVVGLSSY